MTVQRALYLGPRLRRLRRELGMTQQVMADDLGISPSYVALLERNQRPVTADMLVRLARTYRLEVTELAGDEGQDYGRRLAETLRDPLFADIDLPSLEVADLATSFPGITEALLRLHGAYVREQAALADRRLGGEDGGEDPVREAQRYAAAARNHFPTLEARGEALAGEFERAGGGEAWLAQKGVRVRSVPPEVLGDSIRRFDRHNQQLLLDDTLDGPTRRFQVALHVAHSALRPQISSLLREDEFASRTAETLVRRLLAGYAAGAIVMPYARFARATEQRGYDIEALCGLFGASFEQVAHRLTTLHRPASTGGEAPVPFFFIRVDAAGNVSKRLDGAGFPFAAHGGGCPLWTIHSAFATPGEIRTQWLELPGGERFFSIARTVIAGGGRQGRPRVTRAVALACAAHEAPRLVYARGADPVRAEATPIGVTCRLCHRAECPARAVPPIGREILADDARRSLQPFEFAED